MLRNAASRIESALPADWTVSTESQERGAQWAQLSLQHRGAAVVTYLVVTKRTVTSSNLLAAIQLLPEHGSSADVGRPMLVARYFAASQQRSLQERGIAYADATGNLNLMSDDPLILLSERGATADPWRGPGRPTTSLKGLPAAKLVRALVDFAPPYSVAQLADLAGVSLGAAYRLSDHLMGEELITRAQRGPITEVDWPRLLRQWSREVPYLERSTTRGFLEPRGMEALVKKLAGGQGGNSYAVSGSLAAESYAPYAEPRSALVYADDPLTLARDVGLRQVEDGANVILAAPRSPVAFERTSTWRDIIVVAPSQAVADLLGGPGRNPAEGQYLLDWMKENPDAWRRQPDR